MHARGGRVGDAGVHVDAFSIADVVVVQGHFDMMCTVD